MSIAPSPDLPARALLHTVAKLHYESDLPQVEIARRLNLSTATVSRLLRRSLKRLNELTGDRTD